MTYKELKQKHTDIFGQTATKELKVVFDLLNDMADECKNKDYKNQVTNHFETYVNILKYSFELGEDPERKKVYNKLIKNILELSDEMKDDIIAEESLVSYSKLKKEVAKQSPGLVQPLDAVLKDGHSVEDQQKIVNIFRQNMQNIFKLIWLTDKFGEMEINMIKRINDSPLIPWDIKSLVVSGLTFSLFRHFDQNKLLLLFSFYDKNENQVWQRALVGIILNLYYYDSRLSLYPKVTSRLKLLKGKESFEKNCEAIIIQFLKAKETEKVTRKIQEEIFPEIIKMKSKFDEKLDLNNIISSKTFEDKNPDWEVFFEDAPGAYDKFEEFSKLQMEGSDVFMSAFSMLKGFSFFQDISNWFNPFYKENQTIHEELQDVSGDFNTELFIEGLERSSFLCNSDKYSFCLNVKNLPSEQKSMMLEFFNMELNAMNEVEDEDKKVNQRGAINVVFTQYIQDLYRFFKLYPYKNEFPDVFNLPHDIHHAYFFNNFIDNKSVLRNIGEFYFEKDYHQKAAKIFLELVKDAKNFELLEKIGYCQERSGDYNKALEYYRQAELLHKDRPWVIKKIAFCYRHLKNYEKALDYYHEAEKRQPDNLFIQASMGHTYMEKEDFETALKYYFKVEYLAPDNKKIQRPIAWCSFVLGKFDTAQKYFTKVIEQECNKNDHLNLGHVEWCKKNKQKAIEHYIKSVELPDNIDWFDNVLHADTKYLINNGIPEFDIPLMIDYIKIIVTNRD